MELTVTGSTRLMFVIGDPIVQARTPQVINPIYAAKGADIVCLPLHVSVEALATCWAGLKAAPNVVGFGVTLPHKAAALELCDSLDPLAELLGASNIVRREADGSLRGYQFDGAGFVAGMHDAGVALKDRSCLLLGAGGAATGVAYALLKAGMRDITVANRTIAKAEALAARVNEAIGDDRIRTGPPHPEPGQLIVNATSLGLNPDDPLPMPADLLQSGMEVAEVIAQPDFTPLLVTARDRGLKVHSGMQMIRGQAGAIADHLCEVWG